MPDSKPSIWVIWGDDIGLTNLSCYGNLYRLSAEQEDSESPNYPPAMSRLEASLTEGR